MTLDLGVMGSWPRWVWGLLDLSPPRDPVPSLSLFYIFATRFSFSLDVESGSLVLKPNLRVEPGQYYFFGYFLGTGCFLGS